MQAVTKLNFRKPTLEDFPEINCLFKKYGGTDSCEGSAVTLFLWEDYYNEMFAVAEDSLFISAEVEGQMTYLIPYREDIKNSVELLKAHTKALGIKLSFFAPEGNRFNQFKKYFEEEFNIIETRDDFEYIYNSEDLINLSGKKYHSKRNHISAFTKANNWSYEEINTGNMAEVCEMADLWLKTNERANEESLISENRSIKGMLSNFDAFGLKGGLVRVEGKVVAFAFGSEINENTFDVHIEKALPEYRTAYAIINREFAKNALSEYKFINRDDDMGLEGLRKAKLSYYPVKLLKKYVMEEK